MTGLRPLPRSPRRLWVHCVLALVLWPLLARADDLLQNSFDLSVPLAPCPVTTHGQARLFYELHLRNFSQRTLVPEQITVVDGNGRPLARYAGAELQQRLVLVPEADAASQVPVSIAPGRSAVLYVELAIAPGHVPGTLSHSIKYRADGTAADAESTSGGSVTVASSAEAALGPPLRGGPWVAVFHPAWERGHRRVFYTVDGRARIPGRFAMDFVKVDADGRLAQGDADLVRNAHAYGNDVLAVANATVVAVRNDFPEAERLSENKPQRMRDGSGNYIVLDIGGGRHAFYEHLRPHSVRVAPGQQVKRGDVLAQVGFSGTGNWPHLHFHVADAPSLLGAEGLPFALTRFREIGSYPDIALLGKTRWSSAPPESRTNERPGDDAVLLFGD